MNDDLASALRDSAKLLDTPVSLPAAPGDEDTLVQTRRKAAQRQQTRRTRKAKGRRCVMIEYDEVSLSKLVAIRYLADKDAGDSRAIKAAIEKLLRRVTVQNFV